MQQTQIADNIFIKHFHYKKIYKKNDEVRVTIISPHVNNLFIFFASAEFYQNIICKYHESMKKFEIGSGLMIC